MAVTERDVARPVAKALAEGTEQMFVSAATIAAMPTNAQLTAFTEHLLYDVEMLFGTADLLEALEEEAPWVVRMGLIETFALKARSLIDFLWKDASTFKTDALAVHYFDDSQWAVLRPEMESTLDHVGKRAGREIAHLTYHRVSVAEEAKGWAFLHVAGSIGRCLRVFVDHVPITRVLPAFTKRVYAAMPDYLGFPVAISWPSDSTLPFQLAATMAQQPERWADGSSV